MNDLDTRSVAHQRLLDTVVEMKNEGYPLDEVLAGLALFKWKAIESNVAKDLDDDVKDAALDDVEDFGFPCRLTKQSTKVRELCVLYEAYTAAANAVSSVYIHGGMVNDTVGEAVASLAADMDRKRDTMIRELINLRGDNPDDQGFRQHVLLKRCAEVEDLQLVETLLSEIQWQLKAVQFGDGANDLHPN